MDHNYAGCEIDPVFNNRLLPVLSGDILLHNGFRYVLEWANMDDWKWEDDIEYKWIPFGNNADDAPEVEFSRKGMIPIRHINEAGNILWEIEKE